MKKIFLTALLTLAVAGMASAQNYIIVNSEKVFKSLNEYNTAITMLDSLAKEYQADVDNRFAQLETYYNNYMAQKASLSAATRQAREEAILAKEKANTDYQQQLFGTDGTLMKKRLETIQPIQKKVFAAIEAYAVQHGYDLVMDSANNATLLYNNAKIDHTQQVINALK
ncbi:MAG: OmpH family outer membrane protein [Alistipes sp.]